MIKLAAPRLKFWQLLQTVWSIFRAYWKVIGGIVLLYSLLSFYFGQALNLVDVTNIEQNNQELGVASDSVAGKILVAGQVFIASAAQDQIGGVYMLFVTVFTTLALIWVLRHVFSNKTTTVKMAFYNGTYAIVPFILLMGMALIQMLPLLGGLYLFELARQDVLIHSFEIYGGLLLLVVLPLIWSAVMLINTVFALIIVTIPDTKPLAAYRSARELVKGKKSYLFRQLLLSGVLSLVLATGLLVVVIAVAPALAPIFGILLNALYLPLFVVIVYILYRGLISEPAASQTKSRKT